MAANPPEEKQENLFLNPVIATKENQPAILSEHGGKQRVGLPEQQGDQFPWLEVETKVPEDREYGPRIRCSYCVRNKPKPIKLIKKEKYPRYKGAKKKEQEQEAKAKKSCLKDRWSSSEGRPIKGMLKRNVQDHSLTFFHAERFSKEASEI